MVSLQLPTVRAPLRLGTKKKNHGKAGRTGERRNRTRKVEDEEGEQSGVTTSEKRSGGIW